MRAVGAETPKMERSLIKTAAAAALLALTTITSRPIHHKSPPQNRRNIHSFIPIQPHTCDHVLLAREQRSPQIPIAIASIHRQTNPSRTIATNLVPPQLIAHVSAPEKQIQISAADVIESTGGETRVSDHSLGAIAALV